MKLLLSSFGLNTSLFGGYFSRMPAVSMASVGTCFVPDYPVILLFDKVVIDEKTFEALENFNNKQYFKEVGHLIEALNDAGRLEIHDFEKIISPYQSQIDKSIEYDLSDIGEWREEFERSVSIWHKFANMAKYALMEKYSKGVKLTDEEEILLNVFEMGYWGRCSFFTHDRTIGYFLKNWRNKMDLEVRYNIQKILGEYLRYTATNLLLSDKLEATLHDWSDFEPLYRKKLNISLKTKNEKENEMSQIRKLFEVICPDFEPKNPSTFVKSLDDPRIESLRDLVQDAVAGKISFDEKYANEILREVLKVEKKISFKRKIVGWATLPVHFIPWAGTPMQKISEELISKSLEIKARKGKEWFYLISDISKL